MDAPRHAREDAPGPFALGRIGRDAGDRGDVAAAALYLLRVEAGTILDAGPPVAGNILSGHESLAR